MPANSPAPSAAWRRALRSSSTCCTRARTRSSTSRSASCRTRSRPRPTSTTATSASANKGTDVPKLGMTVAPANSVAGAGKDGVVVTEVDPKSAAAERGFKEGDVILEVAGKSVTTAGDVRDAINAARSRQQEQRSDAREERRFVAVRGSAAGQGLNTRWRVSPALVAPADGSFRGAGPKLAPSSYLSMEYAPLRRKGLRAVRSPSFTARFFHYTSRGVPGRLASAGGPRHGERKPLI